MPKRNEFSQWLDKKYLEWQMAQGERVLLKDFADWLGLSNQLLSHYMNGRNKPTRKDLIEKIATKLGDEVYDILGVARPNARIQALIKSYDEMDDESQAELLEYAKQLMAKKREKQKQSEIQQKSVFTPKTS